MSKISFVARIGWEAVLLLAAIVVLALGVAEGHFFGGGGLWPDRLVRLHEGPAWAAFLLPVTIAIVVGILVSRLFDWLGTRPPAPAPVPADIASDGPDH